MRKIELSFLMLLVSLLGGSIGLGFHFLWPVAMDLPKFSPPAPAVASKMVKNWSVKDFDTVWEKPLLRQPPPLPPTTTPEKVVETIAEPVPPPLPVPLKLKGILYSEGSKIAVFESTSSVPQETFRLRVGESAAQTTLKQIRAESVQIEFDNRVLELSLEDKQ